MEYLNTATSVVNLAKRNIENRKKGFANASDYLVTSDDSDSITAVKFSKRLETSCKMVA